MSVGRSPQLPKKIHCSEGIKLATFAHSIGLQAPDEHGLQLVRKSHDPGGSARVAQLTQLRKGMAATRSQRGDKSYHEIASSPR